MTALQQCRDALAAMTAGSVYKTIQGETGWHVKTMPKDSALELARFAILAADTELASQPEPCAWLFDAGPGNEGASFFEIGAQQPQPETGFTLVPLYRASNVSVLREPLTDAQIIAAQGAAFNWLAEHTNYNGGMGGDTWDQESGRAVMRACAEAWGVKLCGIEVPK
jgi:hypothetical protein